MPTSTPRAGDGVEAGEREVATEAETLEVRVDADHVDLADVGAAGVGVQLGPAERGQAPVALVEEEAGGVEPRLRLALAQALHRPAALFRVRGEGAVVDLDPRRLVLTGPERTRGDVDREAGGQGAAHLVEVPAGREPEIDGARLVGSGGVEHPPVDRLGVAGGAEHRADETARQRVVGALGRVDDDLEGERAVPRGQLGVADRRVVAVRGDRRLEAGTAAPLEVEQQVVRQRDAAIGGGGPLEQRQHTFHGGAAERRGHGEL